MCLFCVLKDSVHRQVCKSTWNPDVYFSSLSSTALHGKEWGWVCQLLMLEHIEWLGHLVREYLRSFWLWFFKIGATDVLPSLTLMVLEIMSEICMTSGNKNWSSWLNRKHFTNWNFSGSWNCIFKDLIYDY